MAELSDRLRKFREKTGQTEEPVRAEEAGAEEGDLADYVMPLMGLRRNVLKAIAQKGGAGLGKAAAAEGAKEGAELAGKAAAVQGAKEVAKEGVEEVVEDAAAAKAKQIAREAAKIGANEATKKDNFWSKFDSRKPEAQKPMPGEAPFKGEVPAPAGQKVGANKPPIEEGPKLDYSQINKMETPKSGRKLVYGKGKSKNEEAGAGTITYSQMGEPKVKPGKK